jgi:hypothetical protein
MTSCMRFRMIYAKTYGWVIAFGRTLFRNSLILQAYDIAF